MTAFNLIAMIFIGVIGVSIINYCQKDEIRKTERQKIITEINKDTQEIIKNTKARRKAKSKKFEKQLKDNPVPEDLDTRERIKKTMNKWNFQ